MFELGEKPPELRRENKDEAFERALKAVLEFREKNGRWPSKSSDDFEERVSADSLERWRRQTRYRNRYNSGESLPPSARPLSPEKITKLEQAGIILDPVSERREKRITDMVSIAHFMCNEGRDPSHHSKDAEERRIGYLLKTLRTAYRNEEIILKGGKPKSTVRLSREDQNMLLDLGIVLDKAAEKREKFNVMIDSIIIFRENYGRLPSAKSRDPEEVRLGRYVDRWRIAYLNEAKRLRGMEPTSADRLSPIQLGILVRTGILKDLYGVYKTLSNIQPRSKEISSQDVVACFPKKKQIGVGGCISDYVSANSNPKYKDDKCNRCVQGKKVRIVFAESRNLSPEERMKLGIID